MVMAWKLLVDDYKKFQAVISRRCVANAAFCRRKQGCVISLCAMTVVVRFGSPGCDGGARGGFFRHTVGISPAAMRAECFDC